MTNSSEQDVRSRLRAVAKSLDLTTPQAQLLLCQERFLARLSSLGSDGQAFVWKGGSLILRLYRTLPIPRYTVDIDLLLKGRPMRDVQGIFKRAMAVVLTDGFQFQRITSTPMERDTPYGGDRFEIDWTFFGKQSSQTLKIDVCAGDVVNERNISTEAIFLVPSDEQDLSLKVYPPEFVFAEKLETAVRFGTGNSRFKDYIDMWSMTSLQTDPELIKSAVQACFSNRSTPCSMAKIRAILQDADFAVLMDRHRERSFAHLKLPSAAGMFAAILQFVEALGLPR